MISTKHRKFAHGIAIGLSNAEAYRQAYGTTGGDHSAGSAASRLLKREDVATEILRLRTASDQLAGSAVLTLKEKREFLARVVRATIATLPSDSDLWNSIKSGEDFTEYKLPCKLAAIRTDNDLAGEGNEADGNAALLELIRRIRK